MDESKLIARILDGHTDDYGYFIERYGDSVEIGRASCRERVCQYV